jgi:putative sigma-54 modulation protein
MNIQIKGSNISLTDAIQDYVEKKLGTLSKFIDAQNPSAVCNVEVGKTSTHHKHGDVYRAEFRVALPGKNIYVQAEQSDLYAAIDKVKDEAHHALSANKDRQHSRIRRGGAKIKNMIKGLWRSDGEAEQS